MMLLSGVLHLFCFLYSARANVHEKIDPAPVEEVVLLEINTSPLLPEIDDLQERTVIKETAPLKNAPLESEPLPERVMENTAEADLSKKPAVNESVFEERRVETLEQEPENDTIVDPERILAPPSDEPAVMSYRNMIKQKIESVRRYPAWAKKQGFQGNCKVRFTLFPDGKINAPLLAHSSGFEILDREALASVSRAVPFRPFPNTIKEESLLMDVVILYELK